MAKLNGFAPVAATNVGAGAASKPLILDAQGKAAGRVLETDGAALDTLGVMAPVKRTVTIAAGVRAFFQPSVDFAGSVVNTLFKASVTGVGCNSITLTFVGDGVAKAGSITKVGNVITVHFQPHITTVADVEALFPAVCTAGTVSVKTTGTGATLLEAATDVFGPLPMHGGTAGSLTAAAGSQVISLGAALPANARLLGVSVGEGAFTGFNNDGGACTATASIEGTGGTADISAAVNIAAGQTGFPKIGAAGGQGYPMALHSSQQCTVTLASNVNLNTLDVGSVTIDLFYLALA